MRQVLLVDDDLSYYEIIKELSSKDYNFLYISEPKMVLQFLKQNHIDLILMDWNLGSDSGIDLLKKIKNEDSLNSIPIMLVTGNSSTEHMVEGLDSGADDYITKPFNLKVLFSKIKANIRKKKNKFFNENNLEVILKNDVIKLRFKEFIILKALVMNPDKVFSRKELNNLTAGEITYISERTVDTYVKRIREKLKNYKIIKCISKKGYQISLEECHKIFKSID